MNTLSYRTESAKKEDIQRQWYIVDAEDMVVGSLASQVAAVLRGKNKPIYTPHVDTGDFVIIVNADKVRFTGTKWDDKEYLHYTGYPGGQRTFTAKELLARKPEAILERGIKGMLPKNKLGRAMYKKLFVYTSADHPHQAQKPVHLKID